MLKQLRRPKSQAHLVGPSDDLDTENRISPEVKKVFVNANPLESQEFAPYRR